MEGISLMGSLVSSKRRIPRIIMLALVMVSALRSSAQSTGHPPFYDTEWNTVMFESTYRILGPAPGGKGTTVGAGFVVSIVWSNDKAPSPDRPVLVTAAHVLNGIEGEVAILDMRVEMGDAWNEVQIPVHIRHGRTPLWEQHPVADVAALPLTDKRILEHLIYPLITTTQLATDDWLKSFQIHPGDEVSCLGYPDAVSSQYGFPILRTGRIASFPIIPTVSSRPLYIDFPVFGGNSGGPAYIVPEGVRNQILMSGNKVEIIGLVVMRTSASAQSAVSITGGADQKPSDDLQLAILEPSTVILETLSRFYGKY
jgi:hypothetical protein